MIESDAILTRFMPLHPKKIDLSLGRIERLLGELGSPERRLPPTIHVAGTNGKGSTIAFMRAILEAAGRRVHVYTSPYLVRFHERIRLAAASGGRLVDDERLAVAFDACERANNGHPISIFEITTAAAFKLFSETPADYLLLEVGLGGRYDATNVIERPLATAVTPISMDHIEFLGDTLEKIAFEKAGIFKAGVPAIVGPQPRAALETLEREGRRVGAPLFLAGEDFRFHEEHGRLVYEDSHGLIDLPLPRLAGRHQQMNAATAIAVLRETVPELEAEAFELGLTAAEWPARLQRLGTGRVPELAPRGADIWLDGGHNEGGGRVLAEAMADFEEKSSRPLVLVCGMLTTKDTGAFLASFKGLAQELIAVPITSNSTGRTAADVAGHATDVGLHAASCDSVEAALRFLAAREWRMPPRILITGSLYLAGEVLALNGTPPE
ncbi:MAG: bifunctional folylpolyglutamate synthase/dihydrofolate synthase [Methylobacteriaceae bacterium]|nr:bifunctional folylpolyglutamate synthase/dihydrofolate synthase [Methylobacteriaceae bacterium]